MATIGERLTEARKNFGIDIRTASEATRIRGDFLIALEENKPERINLADVYKIGFLKNYSKYLKLDSAQMVAEFRTQIGYRGSPPVRAARGGNEEPEADAGEGETGGNDGTVGKTLAFAKSGKGIAIAVAAVIIIAVAAVLVRSRAGNAAENAAGQTENVAAAPTAPTPATQLYEFQIISKIPQNVTVTDRYGRDVPVEERAVLLDNQTLSAGVPKILRGRGVLEVRDSGGNNLEIRFPTRDALLLSNDAQTAVKFEESDAQSKPFTNGGNWWTADPYSENR